MFLSLNLQFAVAWMPGVETQFRARFGFTTKSGGRFQEIEVTR